MTNKEQQEALQSIEVACHQVESPMQRMEHRLLPLVTFLVMPVFAFANAGVSVSADTANLLMGNISLGIITGLVIGKPLGILFFSWLAIRLKIASLPDNISFAEIAGVGLLAGVGFTMSLFITDLAFASGSAEIQQAKLGTLLASFIAGVSGYILLKTIQKRK